MAYLLAHDLGTSGDKAVLFTLDGRVVAEASADYPTSYPMRQAAEQDPQDWWRAFCQTTRDLLTRAACPAGDILAVSFSAQMNACLPVDKAGQPLRPAMIWADQRAQAEADRIADAIGRDRVYRLTGQKLSASFGVAKMAWFRGHEPALYNKTACFLQPKDYLAFRLTGRMASDYSDASHLALMDLHSLDWSADMLQAARLDRDKLPELRPSTALAGKVTARAAAACGLLSGTPVVLGGGDGPCATAGAGISRAGQAYCCLGTSAWVAALADKPYLDPEQRTFNLLFLDGRQVMTLGATQAAGLSLQWAVETLFAGEDPDLVYARLDRLLDAVPPGSQGALFLPYLLGERSPWWNARASGSLIGLHPSHTRETLLRAVMEGVGLNLRLVLDALSENAAIPSLRLIGGGARNRAWAQVLCDIWEKPVHLPRMLQYAGSAGAALCAGIGVGVYDSLDAAAGFNPVEQTLAPNPAHAAVYHQAKKRLVAVYQALDAADYRREE